MKTTSEIIDIKAITTEMADIETIKKILSEKPINFVEYADKFLKDNNYKKLFRIAVDNDYPSILISDIVNKNYNNIKRDIYSTNFGKVFNSGSYEKELTAGQKFRSDFITTLLCEEEVKQCKEYDRKYFNELLERGNIESIEIIIIKLYKKLEAKLRLQFNAPDGEIAELLEKSFNANYDDDTFELLTKLRLARNNITHSNSKNITLSLDEIKRCIECICEN